MIRSRRANVRLHCAFAVLALIHGTAAAVVDPQLQKDETPVVVHCWISDVVTQATGGGSRHAARCTVLRIVRSNAPIELGDVVTIAYEIHDSVFEREQAPAPGPAPPTPPPRLHDGDVVVAYLRAVRDANGKITFVPSIGMDSFEPATR